MTPTQSQSAINYALQQTFTDAAGDIHPVTKNTHHALADKVREYFNTNKITYSTFSYDDLKPYLV